MLIVGMLFFLAAEGAILWHLVRGLRRGRFAFADTPSVIERASQPIRYWGWVVMLVVGMIAVGWFVWDTGGWRLGIIYACARDVSYCP
ncbi:hypothetical protein DMC25_09580 [Caulobacter sp. D4A]|uniref:hypothetical protein n=1 Tax=unclassified Caulobacter TaxID=2648921 RepID=UPI000D72C95F|nr:MULTISPECIES: hypothetical protein [unclassified Caulobacter]PXA89385.1 hypothetical protein DMC25_09580 [Caulobacter sp. D4A]PXA95522.1 hypothetical protein DMC18_03790 [Caulobacter sp. D5]